MLIKFLTYIILMTVTEWLAEKIAAWLAEKIAAWLVKKVAGGFEKTFGKPLDEKKAERLRKTVTWLLRNIMQIILFSVLDSLKNQ